MSNVRDHQSTQPVIRFKGFTDAWEKRKLGEVVKKVKSYSLSRDVERDEITGYKYVHYGDIHTGVANIITCQSDLPNIEPAKYEELRQNDLVVADASEDYQGIAEPALVLEEPRTHLVSGLHTIALRPKTSNGLYLYYLLHTASFKHFGYRTGTGLKVFGISWPNLSKFEFFIPTRAEQDRIVVVFEHLDNLIAVNQRKGDVLQNLKKGLLQRLFASETSPIPDIRFKGFTDAWEKRKLGDVAERVRNNDGRMNLPILTISAGKGWLTQRERFSQSIAGKELENYTLLSKGELSYNHGNSKLAKYGAVFALKDYDEALVPRVYHSFDVSGKADSGFVEYLFASKTPDSELRKLISSGARMDGLLNINYEAFMGISILLPSVKEQRSISRIIQTVSHLIAATQRKGEVLKNLKKALLQKMFV
jgi:type I restriction enzyme S subunit